MAPVKVTFGAVALIHTDVAPLIVAVGKELTVTVAVIDVVVLVQGEAPPSALK